MNKRGRPAGSVSFIPVKLTDLNKILKPDAVVLVDRRYAILLGSNSVEVQEGNADVNDAIVSSAPVDFKVD